MKKEVMYQKDKPDEMELVWQEWVEGEVCNVADPEHSIMPSYIRALVYRVWKRGDIALVLLIECELCGNEATVQYNRDGKSQYLCGDCYLTISKN